MYPLTDELIDLHHKLLEIVARRGGPFTYKIQNRVPVLAINTHDWTSYHPPFLYSLDALAVVEKLLTPSELKDYADKLRCAVLEESNGIMTTQALAQIAPAAIRFKCICLILLLYPQHQKEIARRGIELRILGESSRP